MYCFTTSLVLCLSAFAFGASGSDEGFSVKERVFGITPSGETVTLYTLDNGKGMRVGILNLGGAIVFLETPDRDGQSKNVVLGSDTVEGYLSGRYGAVTGRFANRISQASFPLDGKTIHVTRNAGAHHIHGGRKGFGVVLWKGEILDLPDQAAIRLTYVSADGEEGYPGTVTCGVTFSLKKDQAFTINYHATTDKPTVINLTHHAYFNLAGAGQGSILGHVLKIDADAYTVADKALIPTGEIRPVKDTPLDFQTPQPIGARIDLLTQTRGYDHNYAFPNWNGTLRNVAQVFDPMTGRVLTLLTTEPGVQLYTANHFNNVPGPQDTLYQRHHAFCLETQHFPDSPNHADFPSTILRPDHPFDSTTQFQFSIR